MTNNNLPFKIYCENIMDIIFKKKKKERKVSDHKIFLIIINPIFHHTRTQLFYIYKSQPIVYTTNTLLYNYKPILHHIPKVKE